MVRLASAKAVVPAVHVAVKSIKRALMKNNIEMLEEELLILQRMDHPNIVKFHAAYIDDTCVHIVMEYCKGGELSLQLLKSKVYKELDEPS